MRQIVTQLRGWLDASFRAKVLMPVVVCLVGGLAIVVGIVDYQVGQQSEGEARNTLETANAVIRYSEALRRNNLMFRFNKLPNQPLWRRVFQLDSSHDLRDTLRDLMEVRKADMLFYVSNDGRVLDSEANDPAMSMAAFQTAAGPALKQALQGAETMDTFYVGGKLYDTVAIPSYNGERQQTGVIVLGAELGGAAAQEFSQLTQSQIALFADGHYLVSTLPGLDNDADAISAFKNAVPATVGSGASAATPMFFKGVHYYWIAGRFPSLSGDTSLGYVLMSSCEQPLAAGRMTQQVLLGSGLLAILLATMAVWYCVNRTTYPLRELRNGAEAVSRGDLSRRVPVRSRDECGELALAFNQMTENFQHSRAQLEQTVDTLKTTQAQLIQSEKLSAIGQFVAGVAHELNNPLTAVIGFSELLKNRDPDAAQRQHFSEVVLLAAKRCQKIVQSLLSFARRDKPERKPIYVNPLVEAVLCILEYPLRTGNIEVVSKLSPHLPMVLGDANQLQQVFLNIIKNAQEAMETHQSGGRIEITTEAVGANVLITIQDDGPGISENILPRIFDPFFTTKKIGKGTGLGLSLSYGIIQSHGGKIRAISQNGEGAVFIIELPAAEIPNAGALPPPEMPELAAPDAHEGAGKRVLVIDDEEPILNLIREELGGCGYDVVVASNGEAGLSHLSRNNFDLAFCDWKMPGMNGRQVYEQLSAINPQLCQRLIFVTGDIVNNQTYLFLQAEKLPYLSKPFTLPELHSIIKTVLHAKAGGEPVTAPWTS